VTVRAQVTTVTGCRVTVIEGSGYPELQRRAGHGHMLTLDMGEGDGRHAEVYLDEGAIAVISRGLRDSKPRLGYKKSMQCVGHEIAPNSHPEEAEILVAGYSFCYPCGNAVLGVLLSDDPWSTVEILRMFRDGVIAVTE